MACPDQESRRRAPRRVAPATGGSRCRLRPGTLRTRTAAAASPESAPRTADPRCTSAARGAADGRRSCDPRRSFRGCTWRRPALSRILICLATRFMLICSTSRSDDLQQIFVGERGEQDHFVQAVQEFRIEGLLHFGHHLIFHLGRQARCSGAEKPMGLRFSRKRAPRLEVMMMMVFLKSTVLPRPSVNWPSSNTCSRML